MGLQKRPKIEEKVRYLLWAKSAGRCQFNGCNKILYQDEHTQIEMNFAEVAHIIGQGGKGPRSYDELKYDKKYINDISNLMVLCPRDHKLVDKNPDLYSPEVLREMKAEHENKVRLATEMKIDDTSHVVIYRGRVGAFQPAIEFKGAMQAMFPDYYPADPYALELSMSGNLAKDNDPKFWDTQAENLEAQFRRTVEPLLENSQERNHYSIFAFAPIPLLIKLGTLLPDKYPAQVYQLTKEPPTWKWEPDPDFFDLTVSEPAENHKTVALNLSLSADIDDQRIYDAMQTKDVSIWRVDIPETIFPKNDHLRGKGQLILFSRYIRKLLNRIKMEHGQDTTLHIFPAISVAYAVEMGRVWSEKADMPLVIYDQNNISSGFLHALTIK